MSSAAIATVVKIMESLPIEVQDRIVEHLQDYIDELQDEIRWNNSFHRTQLKLAWQNRQTSKCSRLWYSTDWVKWLSRSKFRPGKVREGLSTCD